MLHVLNGDATRVKLAQTTIGGTHTVWADALHEGPVPADLSAVELRRLRAAYFAKLLGEPEERVLDMATRWDEGLGRYNHYEEVVFWLEHDLFDQLILLRHLDWLSTIDRRRTHFSLICIDRFPGVADFSGLGPLTPAQLETLPAARVRVSDEQIALGREGWALFRAADPHPLLEWIHADRPALPFVAGALRRHFDDYPSTRDGLSRSERQMLSAIAEGHTTFVDLFVDCQRMEERVYMGDATFLSILRKLAGGSSPLVTLTGGVAATPGGSLEAELTDAGRRVLAGKADWLALNGVDRWMGGVHLTPDHVWRWDGASLTR